MELRAGTTSWQKTFYSSSQYICAASVALAQVVSVQAAGCDVRTPSLTLRCVVTASCCRTQGRRILTTSTKWGSVRYNRDQSICTAMDAAVKMPVEAQERSSRCLIRRDCQCLDQWHIEWSCWKHLDGSSQHLPLTRCPQEEQTNTEQILESVWSQCKDVRGCEQTDEDAFVWKCFCRSKIFVLIRRFYDTQRRELSQQTYVQLFDGLFVANKHRLHKHHVRWKFTLCSICLCVQQLWLRVRHQQLLDRRIFYLVPAGGENIHFYPGNL